MSISFVQLLCAQDGILKGVVKDGHTNEPLIGALIVVDGTEIAAESDIEGNYSLNIPAGSHQVIFSYDTYHSDTLKNLVLTSGQIVYKNVTMKANVTEMETINFVQKIDKSGADEVLKARKEASGTSDGVDQKTLTKSNNPTVSDGLKKVTGASIQDGKFAIIRGMGDRYNAGYINGSPLPSTESDRKAFSFDILPTTLVDNLIILKSGSADLTGDFGGGVIKISTKSIPDSFRVNVGLGAQYNSVTTNKSYTAYEGSKTDYLGIDDGLRDRPSLKTTLGSDKPGGLLNDYVEDTKKFNNNYNLQQLKAPFGSRFNVSVGAPLVKKEKFELGVVGAYNYNQTYTNTQRVTRFYKADFDNGGLNSDYRDTAGVMSVNSSGLINVGAKIAKNHRIDYRGMNGIASTISNLSRSGTAGMADGNIVGIRQYSTIMLYNRLRTHQFLGEHNLLGKRLKIDWNISNTKIAKQIPDYRVTTYSSFVDDDGVAQTAISTGNDFSAGNGRFFGYLDESLNSQMLNAAYGLNSSDSVLVSTTVKAGVFHQARTRDFTSYKYIFHNLPQGEAHLNSPGLDFNNTNYETYKTFLHDPTPLPDRRYDANSQLLAGYLMLDQNFNKKLKLSYGLRYEKFEQEVNSGGVTSALKKNVFLPSLNANYSLTPMKSNLRLGAYKSVNRPEFREVAKFAFFDFLQNADVIGNNNLKQADIYNFESRYEFLPTADQIVSIGGFYKVINNPIEQRYDATQPTFRTFTFSNEKRARVYGLELEFKKTFDFIGRKSEKNFFNFLYFTSNLAVIQSRVEVGEGSSSIEGRPLQGQSPYLLNLSLGYDNANNGWSTTFSVNKYGRRLSLVGPTKDISKGAINPNGYNIFENPRTVVDFQVAKTIKKFTIKGTWGDILHQDLIFYNDNNDNRKFDEETDNTIFRSKLGYTFTLALAASF